MFDPGRPAGAWFPASLLCSGILAGHVATAGPPTLESIAVTPGASTIAVGQAQSFRAIGTFTSGTTQALGPAIGKLSPGEYGTCVVLSSGGVQCWGDNQYGQLGDGTRLDSLVARRVKGIANARSAELQSEHACAVLDTGRVKCWGYNSSGELGNGSAVASTVPVAVTGLRSATAVSLGWSYSCALLSGGGVRCWGYNVHGELGNGSNTPSSVPVTVQGISSATALASGGAHSCAVLADGRVQCWGLNERGQLGNGSTVDSRVPVTVAGINDATAIATGAAFSCALLGSGGVKCWGHGGNAELGDGSEWPYPNSSVPVSVVGLDAAVAITAGNFHACAVAASGAVQCWGYNNYGQLGNGSMTASASITPVRASGIAAPVAVAAGAWHTCALLADGAMRCWGLNRDGQLGNRRTTGYTATRWPVNVVGTPGVAWRSGDPSVATITYGGRAQGRAPGNTTITATTQGYVNENAVLTVK